MPKAFAPKALFLSAKGAISAFAAWTASTVLTRLKFPSLQKVPSSLDEVAHDRVQVWTGYPWPGASENGAWLVSGLAQYPGGFESAINAFWNTTDAPGRHCFTWLSDLRACGGDQARQTARYLVASWIEQHGNQKTKSVWTLDYVGRRLTTLILLYDFHGSSAHDAYQALVGGMITRHADFLLKTLPTTRKSQDTLEASAALILAALSMEDKKQWRDIGEAHFTRNLSAQILSDGGHISRAPQKLADVLRLCLDLKRFYQEANQKPVETLQKTIELMGEALQFFRYMDKKLALFHSSQEHSATILDLISHQIGGRLKTPKSLPTTKFERLTQGRTTVLMDIGTPPQWPYDTRASAAPLAFEMTYGKERMIVNCGAHPFSPEWQEALRGTAAHTTLDIDNRNACEIKEDGHIGRKPSTIKSERTEKKTSLLVEAQHDGYVPLNGLAHTRRLYLCERGQDLRGEDILSAGVAPEKHHDYALRFHLHPRVKVSLVKDETEALLRLPSGTGWRFQQEGGALSLQDSIYFGEGTSPVKTQQIVMTGQTLSAVTLLKWAFQREGL